MGGQDRIKGVDGVNVEGFQIKAYLEPDYDPDLSYLGTYTDKPKFPYFDRATKRVIANQEERSRAFEMDEEAGVEWSGREYRYIESGSGDADTLPLDVARLEDYERNEWGMVGVVVKVYAKGIELGYSSVWGVETDSDEGFFVECAKDQLIEALEEAKKKLAELREVPVEVKGAQRG